MASVATRIMATVNAPYRTAVTADRLAAGLVDPASVTARNAAVFAFLSEVRPQLQREFVTVMGLDMARVRQVADGFSRLAGYRLPLAE
ncbi:MAG: hypothetical protein H3C51_03635 [Rubellimicrobium sp.]|nr:hypothetical protein [Rubellimicrobium sp.]